MFQYSEYFMYSGKTENKFNIEFTIELMEMHNEIFGIVEKITAWNDIDWEITNSDESNDAARHPNTSFHNFVMDIV